MKFNKLFNLMPVEQISWLSLFCQSMSNDLLTKLQVDMHRGNNVVKLERSKLTLDESVTDLPQVIGYITKQGNLLEPFYNSFKTVLHDGKKIINIAAADKISTISNVILGFDKKHEMVSLYIISQGNICRLKSYLTPHEYMQLLLSVDLIGFIGKVYGNELSAVLGANNYKQRPTVYVGVPANKSSE